jgi:hypothetical protein
MEVVVPGVLGSNFLDVEVGGVGCVVLYWRVR